MAPMLNVPLTIFLTSIRGQEELQSLVQTLLYKLKNVCIIITTATYLTVYQKVCTLDLISATVLLLIVVITSLLAKYIMI